MGISKTQKRKNDALAKRQERMRRKQEIVAEKEQQRIIYEAQQKEKQEQERELKEMIQRLKNQTDPLTIAENEQDAIINWLVENEINNPEHEQKVGELHAVEAKIRRLSEPWKCDRGGLEIFNTSSLRR